MRKPTRRSMTRKLDYLLSQVVRRKGFCQKCGSNQFLQAAHVFSRKNRSTRWMKDNVFCLCAKCHWYFHQNPVIFAEWVKGMLGNQRYCFLKMLANEPRKWTMDEMQALVTELEECLQC